MLQISKKKVGYKQKISNHKSLGLLNNTWS